MSLVVRPARAADVPAIHGMIGELAEYERLSHAMSAGAEDIARALFGPTPRAFCDLAEINGAPAGFALWFYSFSTFLGRHGIYLEDLFVRPQARRRGVARALLQGLARRCVDEGLGRLEWSVLDWNAPAIAFYDALEASAMDAWTLRRLDGAALVALASA